MRDTCQMMSVNMATESGARQRDFQNVFYATDVKERKKLLGTYIHTYIHSLFDK